LPGCLLARLVIAAAFEQKRPAERCIASSAEEPHVVEGFGDVISPKTRMNGNDELNVVQNNSPPRYSVEALDALQAKYDRKMAELKEREDKAIQDEADAKAMENLRQEREAMRQYDRKATEVATVHVQTRTSLCILF
jgi:hypothetical protein